MSVTRAKRKAASKNLGGDEKDEASLSKSQCGHFHTVLLPTYEEHEESQNAAVTRSQSSRFSLDTSLPATDPLEKCGHWVDTQATFRIPEESDPDDPDSDGSSRVSTRAVRTRTKPVKSNQEQLNLRCEWKNCSFCETSMDSFMKHVSYHIPDLKVGLNEDGEEVYVCQWKGCRFETADAQEVTRHVNFHSYHTKVKCIGSNVWERVDTPRCTTDEDGRNLIPDVPHPFVCSWENCNQIFNNPQVYYYHVLAHVKAVPTEQGGVSCGWDGCKSKCRSVYKLMDHVRVHTKEKVVGCPTCGSLFASKTKFFDHCRRKVPLESLGYQCSHCSKYYSSERILRDHMRHHVNHYKCTFCDMTCPTPSALALHIRYRHADSRPFHCDVCDFAGVTKKDLRVHTSGHHRQPLFCCEFDDCNFSCRTYVGLRSHCRSVHATGEELPVYCCHLCEATFRRGTYLTGHLFKEHKLRLPNGHVRFQYRSNDSGQYHLQTVRYESLEVTQEMMGQPCEDECSQDAAGREIVITIEEIDGLGKVTKTRSLTTREVPLLVGRPLRDGDVLMDPVDPLSPS